MAEAQPVDLVAAERHDHRAFGFVVDGQPGLGLKLPGEIRPQALARQRQRQKIVFAGLDLGGRGQHAGGRAGRARADAVALENADRKAALREFPADRQTDNAAADNGDVEPAVACLVLTDIDDFVHVTLPSLA